jgi:hypothetical protein
MPGPPDAPSVKSGKTDAVPRGDLHHVELWVPDLNRATSSLGWNFEALGYSVYQSWDNGNSWILADTYVVVEQTSAHTGNTYDRMRPGLNHLASSWN